MLKPLLIAIAYPLTYQPVAKLVKWFNSIDWDKSVEEEDEMDYYYYEAWKENKK